MKNAEIKRLEYYLNKYKYLPKDNFGIVNSCLKSIEDELIKLKKPNVIINKER